MKTFMAGVVTAALLFTSGWAAAGQPLHQVLKLRTITVLRCEVVSEANLVDVSSYFREQSRSPRPSAASFDESEPGYFIKGIVRRQRDVAFLTMGDGRPIRDTDWGDATTSAAVNFFVAGRQPDACEVFVAGKQMNVVLSQKAECDTYPPAGICAFDYPIRIVDPATWTRYGE